MLVFLNSLLNSLIYCWKMRPQVAQAQNENTIELYDLRYKTLYGKFTLSALLLQNPASIATVYCRYNKEAQLSLQYIVVAFFQNVTSVFTIYCH